MMAPRNVVFPANGPINIPIGLLPYVVWNPNAPCAQPASNATNGVSAQAFPNPPQVMIEVKFRSVNTGSLVEFWIGEFSGTYSIDFANGTGAGTLSASDQVEVCLVPPAPADPSRPRLDLMSFATDVKMAGGDYTSFMKTCRRGDQAYFYFLATNNDLQNSAEVTVTTAIGQGAGLPDGFAQDDSVGNFNANVYAIADPAGDTFNHSFVDDPATWPLRVSR